MELGVCEAVLKRICRRNGIPKWPYRQVKTIDRYLSKTKESLRIASETYQHLKTTAERDTLITAKQNQMKYAYFVSKLKEHRRITLRQAHNQTVIVALEKEWLILSKAIKQDAEPDTNEGLREQFDLVDAADQLLQLNDSPIIGPMSFHSPEATAGMMALSLSPHSPSDKVLKRGMKTAPPFL